jgi:1-acyl-sn-glycerol-3-phosphate acyltransferase
VGRKLVNFGQLLFASTWTAFWISAAFFATVFTLNRDIGLKMARRLWAPAMVRYSGARFSCDPLPDIDWSKPYILVMNHQSMLDIACAFAAIPTNIRFVAKEQLKWLPFVGWFIWLTGMVFVDRSRRAQALASLEKAGQRIREGATIIAYPEGTRSADLRVMPFKKGPFVLALTAQVPIIPIAIHGSGLVSPKQHPWRMNPADVRMKVGLPIPTAGRTPEDRDALLHEVRAAIIALNHEIGGLGGVETDIAAPGVEGLSAPPTGGTPASASPRP